jgi:hypothetical protein
MIGHTNTAERWVCQSMRIDLVADARKILPRRAALQILSEPDPVRRSSDEVPAGQIRSDREIVTAVGGPRRRGRAMMARMP